MRRLLLFSTDKRLARFYYLVHLRCHSAAHEFRNNNVVCYSCNDEDYPRLCHIADRLHVNYETVSSETRYQRTKRIIEDEYQPGQAFKTKDIIERTNYPAHATGDILRQLKANGYLQTHGHAGSHFYSRVETAEERHDRQDQDDGEKEA